MKTLDPTFQNTIAQPTATITWCWLIERIDGVKLGFTSFDLSFVIDGVTYEPATGFAPSADSSEEGFKQNDSQSLNGILSSHQISDEDLLVGLYQYAKITCFQVDVTNLPLSLDNYPPKYLEVYRGFLGKTTQSDHVRYGRFLLKPLLMVLNSALVKVNFFLDKTQSIALKLLDHF